MKLHRLLLPALLAVVACGEEDSPHAPLHNLVPCDDPAPLLGRMDDRVPDQYVVVFDAGTQPATVTARLERTHGFSAEFVFTHVFPGFSAAMQRSTMHAVRCEPEVRFIEHNSVAELF